MLCDPQRLYPSEFMGRPKLLFHKNGWSWHKLHNFLDPINKQQLASVRPRPGTSSSQPRITVWLHLGIFKPSSNSTISDDFLAQAGWPWAKHRSGPTLACITQDTPGPAHPVDNYKPLQSTTTLPHHSWSSEEGGGWWSVFTDNACSWQSWVNPSHWSANSNQGSYNRRVYAAHTKGTPRVPSLGGRGGCAIGLYRKLTTLGHTMKM